MPGRAGRCPLCSRSDPQPALHRAGLRVPCAGQEGLPCPWPLPEQLRLPGEPAEPWDAVGSSCLGKGEGGERGQGRRRGRSGSAGRERRAGRGGSDPRETPRCPRQPEENSPWLCRRSLRLCAKALPNARFPGHFVPDICPIAKGARSPIAADLGSAAGEGSPGTGLPAHVLPLESFFTSGTTDVEA